jgi:hypothetical protein
MAKASWYGRTAEEKALNSSMTENTKSFINKALIQTNQIGSWLWWGKNGFIGVLSLFFLIFGIEGLIAAYTLNNPMEFIMYFFSSSLIILISLVGVIYLLFRIYAFFKGTIHP